jgi:uncharacterized protein
MRIGLISDTHISTSNEKIPAKVKDIFKGVDQIFHAGDIYSLSVLDELQTVAPVLAARGDDDRNCEDERVKEKHVVHIGGLLMWITHQFFPLDFYSSGRLSFPDTLKELKKYKTLPDIVVFGHTHKTLSLKIENTFYLNPGSATLPNYETKLGTIIILNIIQGTVEVDIIQL